jgi:hypothetical protein
LQIKILKQRCLSADNKESLQMYQLYGHIQPLCSLLPATLQDLKFGINIAFSSKIKIIDGGEWLKSSHVSSTHNSFPFSVCLSSQTFLDVDILDILFGWRT